MSVLDDGYKIVVKNDGKHDIFVSIPMGTKAWFTKIICQILATAHIIWKNRSKPTENFSTQKIGLFPIFRHRELLTSPDFYPFVKTDQDK